MNLEHPAITRTLRTGYPKKEKAHCNEPDQHKPNIDYTTYFIEVYEEHRMSGYDPFDSYIHASSRLAFNRHGNVDLLQYLYRHYVNDLAKYAVEVFK